MNKFYARRLLSLLIVVMLVFPVMSFASGNDDVKIKSVYFQDEGGNMVFVHYEEAISKYMSGEHDFYLAIKDHVGKAELKGRPLYLETNNGRLLNYGMAMRDNVFMLKAILETNKYDMNGEIKFTHELKLVDGVPKIVPYEKPVEPDPDPEPEIVDIVTIDPVGAITVELGTEKAAAMLLLDPTTTIVDSKGDIHTVKLNWDIQNYDGNSEGEYDALGLFELPEGVKNSQGLDLHVKTIVKVLAPKVEEWPEEVEDVFVGKSQLTDQSYANIEIKSEYVSIVKAVYIDNNLGNQMEDQLSQWRVIVEDGTSVEDLRGRIRVESEDPVEEIHVEFKKDILLGEGFGLGNLLVDPKLAKKYPTASKYAVLYCVGNSKDILVLSDRVNLGEYTKDLVQYIEDMNVISIALYDASDNYIGLIENLMVKK